MIADGKTCNNLDQDTSVVASCSTSTPSPVIDPDIKPIPHGNGQTIVTLTNFGFIFSVMIGVLM